MYKLDLEKAEKPDQITNIQWIIEKAREFQIKNYFCYMTTLKPLMCEYEQTVENS